jgi:orotidine-5'-phosphate decarboxylase
VSERARHRLIVALDLDSLAPAFDLARGLSDLAGMFKIGSQLFTCEGPRAVEKLARLGSGIFLDLKFHDIPTSVAGGVSAAAGLPGVSLITVHALGGLEMMRAAAQALADRGRGRSDRVKLLAVTVLTSLDATAMRQIGLTGRPSQRAICLAQLAKRAGLDGVVASAHEVRRIRRTCGPRFLIVVPGVRPSGPASARAGDDQARVATPADAIRAGADYLVVGRPITAARDPRAAAAAIVEEIAQVQRRRI